MPQNLSASRLVGYPELVKSVLRNQYFQIKGQMAVNGSNLLQNKVLKGRDWAVPSYDITGLFANLTSDETINLRSYVRGFSNQENMRMPHSAFSVVMRDFDRLVVLFVSNKADNFFNIETDGDRRDFEKEIGPHTFLADSWECASYSNQAANSWYRSQIMFCDNRLIQDPSSGGIDEKNLGPAKVQLTKLIWFLSIVDLQTSNKVIELVSEKISSSGTILAADAGNSEFINIPETQRALLLSLEPILKKIKHTGGVKSGSPKRGHIRRGHYHTYAGERRWIGEIEVKGGYDSIPATKPVRLK